MYTIKLEKVMTLLIFLLTLTWGSFVSCEESNIKKHILELGNRLNAILVEEKMCNQATNCLNKDFLFIESIPEGIGVTLYGMQNKATATKKIIKECNEMFFWLNRGITIHLSAYEVTKEQVSQTNNKPYMNLRFKEDKPYIEEKKSSEEKEIDAYKVILSSIIGNLSNPTIQDHLFRGITGESLHSEEEKLKRRKIELFAKEQEKEFSKRIHRIFEESPECKQPKWCGGSGGGTSKVARDSIIYFLGGITGPSLVEKIIEECTDTFFKLNKGVSISCLFREGETHEELQRKCPLIGRVEGKCSQFFIILSLKGAE